VLEDGHIAFAGYRGKRQYLTLGNVGGDSCIALIAVDYPRRRRLKLLGHMTAVDLAADPAPAARLRDSGYPARVERLCHRHRGA